MFYFTCNHGLSYNVFNVTQLQLSLQMDYLSYELREIILLKACYMTLRAAVKLTRQKYVDVYATLAAVCNRFHEIVVEREFSQIVKRSVTGLHPFRDSSFWQYKDNAGICRGSLERRLQTTVGSCVMRTCCCCMLKCMRCVCNKLAVSSDLDS